VKFIPPPLPNFKKIRNILYFYLIVNILELAFVLHQSHFIAKSNSFEFVKNLKVLTRLLVIEGAPHQ
jgi:hypothetical protein